MEFQILSYKLYNYLMNTYGIAPKHHVIAVNEGSPPHLQLVIIWQLVGFL